MKDMKGKALEQGQTVVFSVGTMLKTGVVARVRVSNRWGREVSVCRVTLDVPEQRYVNRRWNPDTQRVEPVGEQPPPRLVRDIWQENRILILNPPEKVATA